MTTVCICGVCIPISMLWPLLLVTLRELWNYIYPSKSTKNLETTSDEKKAVAADSNDTTPKEKINRTLKDEDDWNNLVSVISHERPLFARFTAQWCKPCKAVEPLYQELIEPLLSNGAFISVDVDDFDSISAEWKAIPIPVVICIKNGKEVSRVTGKSKEQLEAFLKETI